MNKVGRNVDVHIRTQTSNIETSRLNPRLELHLYKTDYDINLHLKLLSIKSLTHKYNHIHMHVRNHDKNNWHPVNVSSFPEFESDIDCLDIIIPDVVTADTKNFGFVLILTTGKEDQGAVVVKVDEKFNISIDKTKFPEVLEVSTEYFVGEAKYRNFIHELCEAKQQESEALASEISCLLTNPFKTRLVRSKLGEDNSKYVIPPLENRARVASHVARVDASGDIFLKDGMNKAKVFTNIYEAITGEMLSEEKSVLDWGVGCGSVARYIIPTGCDFYGIDIDQVNIDWCKTNLAPGNFFKISPSEETLADKLPKFDLIYSFSVMTHLKQDLQIFWIKRLAEVCKGLMIISVYGTGVVIKRNRPHKDLLNLSQCMSFRDGKVNTDIAGQDPEGTYIGVGNSFKNILSNWSPYVNIIAFINAGQDFVICTPKHKSI